MGQSENHKHLKKRKKFDEAFKAVVAVASVLGFAVYVYFGPYRPLANEFNSARGMTTSEKVAYWGEFLADEAPRFGHVAKLGGGPQVWDRMSVTPSVFDELSFIETVVALSSSGSRDQYYDHVLHLRYRGGRPHAKNRNFLISVHWLAENLDSGFLREATREISKGFDLVESKQEVSVGDWTQAKWNEANRKLAAVMSKSDLSQKRSIDLLYAPASKLEKFEHLLSRGRIVAVVGTECVLDPVFCRIGIVVDDSGSEPVLLRSTSKGQIVREKLHDFVQLAGDEGFAGLAVYSVSPKASFP